MTRHKTLGKNVAAARTASALNPATTILLVGLTLIALLVVYGVQSVGAQSTLPGNDGTICFTSESHAAAPDSCQTVLDGFVCGGPTGDEPRVSPGGELAVVEKDVNGNWDIFLVNLLTGEETQLTTDLADDTQPFWSPDGQWIVYVSNQTGHDELMLLNVITLEQRPLTALGVDSAKPIFAFDGSAVVFQSDRNGSWDLFMVDVDTGLVTQLTTDLNDDTDPCLASGTGWLAYLTDRTGDRTVLLVNLNSLNQFALPLGVRLELLSAYNCTDNGDGSYQWSEALVTYVDGVAVSAQIIGGPLNGPWRPGCPGGPGAAASAAGASTQNVSVYNGRYVGNDIYEWYEAIVTFDANGVPVSEEIVGGPFTGDWQPGCVGVNDLGPSGDEGSSGQGDGGPPPPQPSPND